MPVKLITLMGNDTPSRMQGIFKITWQEAMIEAIRNETGKKLTVKIIDILNSSYEIGSKKGGLSGIDLTDYIAASVDRAIKNPAISSLIAQSFIKNIGLRGTKPSKSSLDKIGGMLSLLAIVSGIAAGGYLLSQAAKFK